MPAGASYPFSGHAPWTRGLQCRCMSKPRLLLVSVLATLALAGSAAAQTRDPSTNTALAILDECLTALRGGTPFDTAMSQRGFKRGSTGGWVKSVGGSVIAASTGTTTFKSGGQGKLCAITITPQSTDPQGLDAAVAARARPWTLKYMSPAPGNGGGVMSGWADLERQGLMAITVNQAPGSGSVGPNTTISVIWR